MPIFLAGGGFDHGRYLDLRAERNVDHDQPLSNLFVCLLQDADIETDTFGQSTTALALK